MADDNSTDVAPDALTRRGLLRVGAIGAGVAGAAWVAPSVLTMDAAAAGSPCSTFSTFNWAPYTSGQAGTGGLGNQVDGVQISIAAANPGGQAFAPNAVVQTGTFGAQPKWWQMRQNALGGGPDGSPAQLTATFSFTRVSNGLAVPLSQFSFQILDIDRRDSAGSGWRDEVWVTDTAGNPIAFTQAPATPPAGGPAGAGSNADRWYGTSNIDETLTTGNLTIAFSAPVSGFRINYRNRRFSDTSNRYSGNQMRIGIANLRWCRIA